LVIAVHRNGALADLYHDALFVCVIFLFRIHAGSAQNISLIGVDFRDFAL